MKLLDIQLNVVIQENSSLKLFVSKWERQGVLFQNASMFFSNFNYTQKRGKIFEVEFQCPVVEKAINVSSGLN